MARLDGTRRESEKDYSREIKISQFCIKSPLLYSTSAPSSSIQTDHKIKPTKHIHEKTKLQNNFKNNNSLNWRKYFASPSKMAY